MKLPIQAFLANISGTSMPALFVHEEVCDPACDPVVQTVRECTPEMMVLGCENLLIISLAAPHELAQCMDDFGATYDDDLGLATMRIETECGVVRITYGLLGTPVVGLCVVGVHPERWVRECSLSEPVAWRCALDCMSARQQALLAGIARPLAI